MPYHLLVALQVADPDRYERYRSEMLPILQGYGGSFSFDAHLAEVLRPDDLKSSNRLFDLTFPDQHARDQFFADPAYLQIRARFFDSSVIAVRRLFEFSLKT